MGDGVNYEEKNMCKIIIYEKTISTPFLIYKGSNVEMLSCYLQWVNTTPAYHRGSAGSFAAGLQGNGQLPALSALPWAQ